MAKGRGAKPGLAGVITQSGERGASPLAGTGFDRRDYVLLPKRPEGVGAGAPSPPQRRGIEFIASRRDWINSVPGIEPDQLVVETALGKSMLPGIQNGDLLFVDRGQSRSHIFGV